MSILKDTDTALPKLMMIGGLMHFTIVREILIWGKLRSLRSFTIAANVPRVCVGRIKNQKLLAKQELKSKNLK